LNAAAKLEGIYLFCA